MVDDPNNPFGGHPFGDAPFGPRAGDTDTLTAEQGSFTLTGQTALFQVQFVAAQGSFALNGTAATFTPSEVAGEGTFTLSGQAALFQVQFATEQGSFTLSGQAAIFQIGFTLETGQFDLDVASITSPDFAAAERAREAARARGFDEALELFAQQRRREREEREIEQLMVWEARAIAEAILPFARQQ